jgi:hypothetical protein
LRDPCETSLAYQRSQQRHGDILGESGSADVSS